MPRHRRSVVQQTLHYWVRPHAGVPTAPIESPAAWRGDDLARRTDWIDELSDLDRAELAMAVQHAESTGRALHDLTRADFPLPTLRPRIERWQRALSDGLGVQVIRGVPVERWDERAASLFFWCLGLHLGIPGAQNRDGELLGHVRDIGASYDDPTVRGYKTSAHLRYHCDAADVVGLLCLQPAKQGGKSRFVSSVTVFNELLRESPELVERLFAPMMLDTRGDGGLDFVPIQPCRYADGQLRTFYHSDYYRSAEQHPGAPRLSDADRALLDRYDAIASTEGIYFDMQFRPGDVQLLSNHTVLHSRTAYEDHPEPERRRHLLRLWLSLDGPFAAWRGLGEMRETARLLGALVRGRLRKRFGRSLHSRG